MSSHRAPHARATARATCGGEAPETKLVCTGRLPACKGVRARATLRLSGRIRYCLPPRNVWVKPPDCLNVAIAKTEAIYTRPTCQPRALSAASNLRSCRSVGRRPHRGGAGLTVQARRSRHAGHFRPAPGHDLPDGPGPEPVRQGARGVDGLQAPAGGREQLPPHLRRAVGSPEEDHHVHVHDPAE